MTNTQQAKEPSRCLTAGKLSFIISSLALITGLALSTLSWLHICSQACNEGHNYRLYGFTFEAIGLSFFPALLLVHFFSLKIPFFSILAGWMLAAALGAELMFIYVQKYYIGSWCPICLAIAASILIACIAYGYSYYQKFKSFVELSEKDQIMNSIFKSCSNLIFFVMGFIIAFSGIHKFNKLQAAENSVKEKISFGNSDSPIEVYIFTDWACPACRSLDPLFESLAAQIMAKAKLTFVDEAIHPETLNFTPYNLSFMLNNKGKYFELRNALAELAQDTKTPTDQQVEELAQRAGVTYKQLNYSEVALGLKYFKHLAKQLNVEGTPTVVVVNKDTKKGKKLTGRSQISEASLMSAIDALSKKS